jgi:hypothetical protein
MTWLLCVTIRKPLAVSSPLIFYVAISGLRSSKKSRACNRVAHFHFASWFNREDGTTGCTTATAPVLQLVLVQRGSRNAHGSEVSLQP